MSTNFMTALDQPASKKWSGRFNEAMDGSLRDYNASIPFDYRLAPFDICGSIAHARMLANQNIITQGDSEKIEEGLLLILDEVKRGEFPWNIENEDVHFNIERALTERIGDAGKKLHTARSRNDQVSTAMRLYVRESVDSIIGKINALQMAFVNQADLHAATIMPGFTHLQSAQPVTFGHHMMAYFEMLERDKDRFTDCRRRVNQLPLGSAALAGTSFPIDREAVAAELRFDAVTRNSIDAVSDRDYVVDFLSASALTMVHLSRLAEELILWSSTEFSFINIPDRYCTGSSIMPQKKNPDIPELARGKAGRAIGNLTAILVVLKGQPLAYNKDNQETQEAMFDTERTLTTTLDVFAGLVSGMSPRKDRMLASAESGYSTATDLAEHLVRQKVPFRDAHEIVGRIVKQAEQASLKLQDISLENLSAVVAEVMSIQPIAAKNLLGGDLQTLLSVQGSVASRDHAGGTSPLAVEKEVRFARLRMAGGS